MLEGTGAGLPTVRARAVLPKGGNAYVEIRPTWILLGPPLHSPFSTPLQFPGTNPGRETFRA